LGSEQNYSALDRVVQLTAADVESSIYRGQFCHITVERPVFITSLPRAGTTLLLEALNRLPGFATHRYRDMPFVSAPLLWDTLSGRFRKTAELKERAHGNGMAVGYDSPEAFEEVIWRIFWTEKFGRDRISLWSKDEEAEKFRQFFIEHLQKMIALRSKGEAAQGRYISKNNANLARIGLLRRLFPDGLVLIPFRHPVDQAASLLRQHMKFLALHRRESFSRRYMEDIGHLEFGELHRPIRFDGIDALLDGYRPDSSDYWSAYWVAAFDHIIRHKDEVILVSYERSCKDGLGAMRPLTDCLHVEQAGPLEAAGDLFKARTRYRLDVEVQDKDLLDRALALHCDLLAIRVV
jgi:hypothetical protein